VESGEAPAESVTREILEETGLHVKWSGDEDRAEAIVERVSVFDCYGLSKAACGDCELIEEADASQEDEAIAVPVRDEPNRRLPFDVGIILALWIQPDADRLVPDGRYVTTDPEGRLTVMVIQIDTELIGEIIAGEDRIGSGVDQTGQLERGLVSIGQRDRHEWTVQRLTKPQGGRILLIRIQPRQWRQISQDRLESARPQTARDRRARCDRDPWPVRRDPLDPQRTVRSRPSVSQGQRTCLHTL